MWSSRFDSLGSSTILWSCLPIIFCLVQSFCLMARQLTSASRAFIHLWELANDWKMKTHETFFSWVYFCNEISSVEIVQRVSGLWKQVLKYHHLILGEPKSIQSEVQLVGGWTNAWDRRFLWVFTYQQRTKQKTAQKSFYDKQWIESRRRIPFNVDC